ncbi:DsrE family protein [Acidobacteriota bacterium]
MTDKLLVVILSGPDLRMRARQGIKFALNTFRSEMMDKVELILFGPGVSLLDPHHPWFDEASELLADCSKEGVMTMACMANAKHYRVTESARQLEVKLLGAQILIPSRIKEGWGVMTF